MGKGSLEKCRMMAGVELMKPPTWMQAMKKQPQSNTEKATY